MAGLANVTLSKAAQWPGWQGRLMQSLDHRISDSAAILKNINTNFSLKVKHNFV